jgi:hypothetical protein
MQEEKNFYCKFFFSAEKFAKNYFLYIENVQNNISDYATVIVDQILLEESTPN